MKKIYEQPTVIKIETTASDIITASVNVVDEGDGLSVSWNDL